MRASRSASATRSGAARPRVRLEHGLLAGGLLVLVAVGGFIAVGAEWALQGFGALGRAYEAALLATLLGLGIQVIFGSFFLALITMPLRRGELPAAADSQAGRAR